MQKTRPEQILDSLRLIVTRPNQVIKVADILANIDAPQREKEFYRSVISFMNKDANKSKCGVGVKYQDLLMKSEAKGHYLLTEKGFGLLNGIEPKVPKATRIRKTTGYRKSKSKERTEDDILGDIQTIVKANGKALTSS